MQGGGGGLKQQQRHDKSFEGKILEEVEEEEDEELIAGESTPALEAARKAVCQESDQLVAESKYSSKVQFRAPDIIEL